MSRSFQLSLLPNIISVLRLLCAPVLLVMAYLEMHLAFAFVLVPALCSDMVDGWLARKLKCESKLGSLLDSLADTLLMVAIIISIWFLHPVVYRQHGLIIAIVVFVWSCAHLAAFIRYGRLASFHTRLLQTGILLFALFALVLFTFGFIPWMLYLAGVVSLVGAVEHFILLALLPEWTPDIRGGLLQLLRSGRSPKTN